MSKPDKSIVDVFEDAKEKILKKKQVNLKQVVTLSVTEEELDLILEAIK